MSKPAWIDKIDSLDEISIPALMEIVEEIEIDQDWLQRTIPDEIPQDNYYRHVLHQGENFEVILAIWPVGTQTQPHDHGTAPSIGVVRLLEGTMFNRIYRRHEDECLEAVHEDQLMPNDLAKVTPSLVHTMGNADTAQTSISLHVYSPLLENVTYWDPQTLQPEQAVLQS